MVEKIEQMITIIRTYPVLYDPLHEEYKNTELKSKIWEFIANALDIQDEHLLQKKWINLRDSYFNYLRTLNAGGFDGKQMEHCKTWPWADQMSFLQKYLDHPMIILEKDTENRIIEQHFEQQKPNRTTLVLKHVEPQEQQEGKMITVHVNYPDTETTKMQVPYIQPHITIQPHETQDITNHGSTLPTPPSQPRRTQQSQIDRIIEYLNKRDKREYDETDLIFLGYSKTIKKMSLQRQAEVKFNIIMEAELHHAVNEQSNNQDMKEESDEIKPEVVGNLVNNIAPDGSVIIPNVMTESVSCIIYHQSLVEPNEATEATNKKMRTS